MSDIANITLFLIECSARIYPSRCVSVSSGSIIVTIEANTEVELNETLDEVEQDNGLILPSFQEQFYISKLIFLFFFFFKFVIFLSVQKMQVL